MWQTEKWLLRDVHVLISRICEYICLHGKGELRLLVI